MLYVNDFLVNNLLGYKEILYHMVHVIEACNDKNPFLGGTIKRKKETCTSS